MKVHHVILVVLLLLIAPCIAFVGTIFVGVFFGGTLGLKDTSDIEDEALMRSMILQQCAKTYSVRNDGKRVENLDDLIPYTGDQAIVDPWGNRFRFRYITDPKSGEEQFVAWTVNPASGKVLVIPRDAAAQIDKEK